MSTYVITTTADQEEAFHAFLEEKQILFFKEEDDEQIPDFVITEIKKSIDDVQAGHFITHEEFLKHLAAKKQCTK